MSMRLLLILLALSSPETLLAQDKGGPGKGPPAQDPAGKGTPVARPADKPKTDQERKPVGDADAEAQKARRAEAEEQEARRVAEQKRLEQERIKLAREQQEQDQRKAKEQQQDQDRARQDAARRDAELLRLRAAFGEEFFAMQRTVNELLATARETSGNGADTFAQARDEIARRYRGEYATLRTSYTEKAKSAGLVFELPEDVGGLARVAREAAPAAALRAQFDNSVAELARAVIAELEVARKTSGSDAAAFAKQRGDIAGRYRAQLQAVQQSIAEQAEAKGVAVDTSDVSKLMQALSAAVAPTPQPAPTPVDPPTDRRPVARPIERPAVDAATPPGAKPAPDATPAPAKPAPAPAQPPTPVDPEGATPKPQTVDATTLRKLFDNRASELRDSMLAELKALDTPPRSADYTTRRPALIAGYREQLGAFRGSVVERAKAAGIEIVLPSDADVAPVFGPGPKPAPVEKKPGDDTPAEGTTPPKEEAKTGPGGKRTRGPRFGGGNG